MKKIKIISAVLVMVTAFAMSAVAAEWNFYGLARVSTFVKDIDTPGNAGDTTTLEQELQPTSRIGAFVKVNDNLTGHFQYGSAGNGGTTANIRQLYGEWNFGPGKLLVGQVTSNMCWFYSNQAYKDDDNLLGYGGISTGRRPQIRLTFGNFKISASAPQNSNHKLDAFNKDLIASGIPAEDLAYKTEVKIPKIEASYKLDLDSSFLQFGAGYQTYEVINGNHTYGVDSYIAALGGGFDVGQFYARGNIFFGQNLGSYKKLSYVDTNPVIDFSQNTMADNDTYGFLLVAGVKINDTFSVEAGYGYTEAELDMTNSIEDSGCSYYLQTTITLAPGVSIVPEIGVEDKEHDLEGNEQDKIVYFGAKWQIRF